MVRVVKRIRKNAKDLLITPLDVAFIIRAKKMGLSLTYDYLNDTWNSNKELLSSNAKKSFINETVYWLDYLEDQKATAAEIEKIVKDNSQALHSKSFTRLSNENYSTDLFFKRIRLELTTEQKGQVRAKMTTVMKNYGYQRKTRQFSEYMKERLATYSLSVFQTGRSEEADPDELSRTDMISFRLKKDEGEYEAIWNESACMITLNAPKTVNDLKNQLNGLGTDYMRILHAMEDYSLLWNVSPQMSAGDIVLFYCPENSKKTSIDLAMEENLKISAKVRDRLQEEKIFYEDNAGSIIALGVLSEDPSKNDEFMEITDLIWLEAPVRLAAVDISIGVNRYMPMTYLKPEEWLELRKEIKSENLLIRI